MPTKLFFKLNEDKQKKIFSVVLCEFSTYGYTNSSTNRIVKICQISKGSLFKYFCNKEDLYFFILDTITTDFIESLEKKTQDFSPDLFQRVIEYSILEFSWYIQNPEKAKLIIDAFTKNDTEIYQKTIKRYDLKEMDHYYRLTKEIELSEFRWDKPKTIAILKWFLKGFNEDFLKNVQLNNNSFKQIQNEYVKSLTEYIEILKTGLLK